MQDPGDRDERIIRLQRLHRLALVQISAELQMPPRQHLNDLVHHKTLPKSPPDHIQKWPSRITSLNSDDNC